MTSAELLARLARRHRHLMLDLAQLLPHAKKDFKLDTKSDRGVINEVLPPLTHHRPAPPVLLHSGTQTVARRSS